MDAFEQVVAEILQHQGYWVWPSYWVTLEPEDRAVVGNTVARVNIDIVAYRPLNPQLHNPPDPRSAELLVIECKSFLDSQGVRYRSFKADDPNLSLPPDSRLYKLFTHNSWREVVLDRLRTQLQMQGLIGPDAPEATLCLVCGKIRNGDENRLDQYFRSRGWKLWGADWLHERLVEMTHSRYHNSVAMIVAKIMHRHGAA